MSTRYRANFLAGVASGIINSLGQTTITGVNFPTTIPPGQYMPIILNPGYYGSANANGGPEIAYVTAVTGTVATVTRGQEGTSSTLASGTTIPWVAGSLASDFTLSSGIRNGDFPAPASSGQIFVSTSTISGQFTNTLPSGTIVPSGVTISSGVTIPLANLASGFLPSGVQVSNVWSNPQSGTITTGVNTYTISVSGFNTYLVLLSARMTSVSGGQGTFSLYANTSAGSITSNNLSTTITANTNGSLTTFAFITGAPTTTVSGSYNFTGSTSSWSMNFSVIGIN